jgi:hypothetical protein
MGPALAKWPGMLRRSHALGALGALLSLGAGPQSALATEGAVSDKLDLAIRRTAVGIDLGFASPVGLGGVTITRAWGENWQIESGVGVGFSGLQVALTPRYTLGNGRNRFKAGAGLSVASPLDAKTQEGTPVWLNVDAAGYEHRFRNGLAFTMGLGLTAGLGGGSYCLVDCDNGRYKAAVAGLVGTQVHLGVAYWL